MTYLGAYHHVMNRESLPIMRACTVLVNATSVTAVMLSNECMIAQHSGTESDAAGRGMHERMGMKLEGADEAARFRGTPRWQCHSRSQE